MEFQLILILEKGKNYLWNGDDKSISATSGLFSKYQDL